jgi:TonB family protein
MRSALWPALFLATAAANAQVSVLQKQVDREAVRARCTSHFMGQQNIPAVPLAAVYKSEALVQETCNCAADRVASNDRLSKAVATVQAAPKESLGMTEANQMLGALLSCAGLAIERQGELPRSDLSAAGREMARAALVPDPAATVVADSIPPRIDPRRCERPEYPAASRRAGAQGRTRLAFYINDVGRFTKVHIVQSSGDTPAHKLLDFQAVAALSACRWEPATRNNERYADWGFVEFVWVLQ